jgi:hypothetical protein
MLSRGSPHIHCEIYVYVWLCVCVDIWSKNGPLGLPASCIVCQSSTDCSLHVLHKSEVGSHFIILIGVSDASFLTQSCSLELRERTVSVFISTCAQAYSADSVLIHIVLLMMPCSLVGGNPLADNEQTERRYNCDVNLQMTSYAMYFFAVFSSVSFNKKKWN